MLSERDLLVVRLAELRGHISSETAARVQNSGENLALGIQPAQFEALLAMAEDIVGRRSRVVAGRFQVLEKLGQGGMGVVYKARDLKLDRTLALKVLGRTEPADLERFAREARTAASLRHPNIVETYDIVTDGDETFITMQYVEGRSLARAAKELDDRAVAEAVAQAAEGLDFAHRKGLIHRDVKPDNILLDGEGRAFLTDFGLAKKIEGNTKLTMSGAAVGTPAYMSPEQARADKEAIGPRSDVYGLGATLYDLLVGRPPFVGETAFEILLKVIDNDPSPLPGTVSPDLAVIAMRAMAREPRERYATAGEFASDLRRWLRGEPIVAKSPSSFARLIRWSKRHSRGVGITAVVVIAITATAVGFALMARRVGHREESERLMQRGILLMDDLDRMPADALLARAEEARGLFEKAVEADASYALPRVWLGRTFHHLNRMDEARRQYDAAIAADPSSVEAYYWRGNLALAEHDRLRDPPRMVTSADGVRIEAPRESKEAAALAASIAADFEKALSMWKQATGATLPERDHAMAILAMARGDYASALSSLDAFVAVRRFTPMARYHRALTLVYLKRFRDARREFAEVARLQGATPSLSAYEAWCLLLAAEDEKDSRAAEECLAVVEEARGRLGAFWRLDLLEGQALDFIADEKVGTVADFEKALACVDRAIQRRSGDGALVLVAARIYLNLIDAAGRQQVPANRFLAEGLSAVNAVLDAGENEQALNLRAQLRIHAAQAPGLRLGERLELSNAALDDLDQSLRRTPDSVDALLIRGALRVRMATWELTPAGIEAGLADIERARTLSPTPAVLAKRGAVLVDAARLKRTKAGYDAALKAIEEALEKRRTADFLVTRGIARLESGQPGALSDAEEALNIKPGSLSALSLKAGAQLKLGESAEQLGQDGRARLREAIDSAQGVLRRAAGSLEARMVVAMARAELWRAGLRRGEPGLEAWNEALREHTALLEIEPEHGSALIGRGNLLGQMAQMRGSQDHHDRAKADFEAAKRAAPNKWEAYNGLAMLIKGEAIRKGREDLFHQAIAEFETAVKLAPDNAILLGNLSGARFAFADHLEKLGKDPLPQLDAALRELDEALTRTPSFIRAYEWKARALVTRANLKNQRAEPWQADVDAAIEACAKAIELDETYAEAWRTRGMIHLDLGRNPEATRDLRKAISLRPAWKAELEKLIPR